MNGRAGSAGFSPKPSWENRKPKMKTTVWFENNPPKAETGFQNGVFLQRH